MNLSMLDPPQPECCPTCTVLYRALANKPCGCDHKKDIQCQGCKAKAVYEARESA